MKYEPVALQEYEKNSCLTGKHLLLYLKEELLFLKLFLFLAYHLMPKLSTLYALFAFV